MYPILFSLGPITLYSYGVLVAIGVLSAVLLIRARAKDTSVAPDLALDLSMTTVVSGFIGARIFYVLQYWDYFRASPIDILKIWEGGIVYYGGLIGGLVGFSIFIRLKRLSFLSLLDLFVPALALAQGFGRIGCFLNGCCYGTRTQLAWGVSFPFLDYRVHPTQLYEALFCFSLAVFLLLLLWRKPEAGVVSFSYFSTYPLGRFLFEFLRGDNAKVALNLTLSQWVGAAIVIAAFVSFFVVRFSGYGNKTNRRRT